MWQRAIISACVLALVTAASAQTFRHHGLNDAQRQYQQRVQRIDEQAERERERAKTAYLGALERFRQVSPEDGSAIDEAVAALGIGSGDDAVEPRPERRIVDVAVTTDLLEHNGTVRITENGIVLAPRFARGEPQMIVGGERVALTMDRRTPTQTVGGPLDMSRVTVYPIALAREADGSWISSSAQVGMTRTAGEYHITVNDRDGVARWLRFRLVIE